MEKERICTFCGKKITEKDIFYGGIIFHSKIYREMRKLEEDIAKMTMKKYEYEKGLKKTFNKISSWVNNSRLKFKLATKLQAIGVALFNNIVAEFTICQDCFNKWQEKAEEKNLLEIV